MAAPTAKRLTLAHPVGGGEVVESVELTGNASVANDTVVYTAAYPVKGVRGFATMSAVNANAVTIKTPVALGNEKIVVDVILEVSK